MSNDPIVTAAANVHRLIAEVHADTSLTTAEKFAACAPLLVAENRILGVTGGATDVGCVAEPGWWFIREWFVDPRGNDADDETDKNMPSRAEALRRAKVLRSAGRLASAFERTNIRPGAGGRDAPWFLWEWEEKQLDEDELLDAAEKDGCVKQRATPFTRAAPTDCDGCVNARAGKQSVCMAHPDVRAPWANRR